MFSTEQRRIAIETFIRFDHGHAGTVAELGYPTRHSLGARHKDYLEHGEVRPPKRRREPKLAFEMRRAAVDYYLAHGKGLAGTMMWQHLLEQIYERIRPASLNSTGLM